jgi:hypothetical protein
VLTAEDGKTGCGTRRAGQHADARPLDRGDRASSASGLRRGPRQGGRGRAGLPLDRGLPPAWHRPPGPEVGPLVETIGSAPKMVAT